jgi:hypothetical protein
MLAVRDHLHDCGACRDEHEALYETKRLVASLAFRAPRAELEALLMHEAERAEREAAGGIAARLWAWLGGVGGPATAELPLYLRPRPVAATALLSIAGLWLASASLDGPGDGALASSSGVVTFEPVTTVSSVVAVPPGNAAPPAAYVAPITVAWGAPSASSPYAQASYGGGGSLMPAGSSAAPAPVLMPVPVSVSGPLPAGGGTAPVMQGALGGAAFVRLIAQ